MLCPECGEPAPPGPLGTRSCALRTSARPPGLAARFTQMLRRLTRLC